jgi:hypothetical protein
MAGLIPTVGNTYGLKQLLNGGLSLANAVVALYSNNYTPIKASIYSNFTNIGSPAPITLTGSSFDYTTVPGTATYAQQTFTFGSAGTTYGYDIYTGTTLIGAELFSDGPYTFGSGGGTVKLVINISWN